MSIFWNMCHFKLTHFSSIFLALSRDNLTQQREFHLRSSAHMQKVHSILTLEPLPENPAIPRISPQARSSKLTFLQALSRLAIKQKTQFRAERNITWLGVAFVPRLGANFLYLPLTQPILSLISLRGFTMLRPI